MKHLSTLFLAVILALSFVTYAVAATEKEDRQIAKNQLTPLFVGTMCFSKPDAKQINQAYNTTLKACDTKTIADCKNAASILKVMRTVFSFYADTPCTNSRPSWEEVKKSVTSIQTLAETYLNAPQNAASANGQTVKISLNDGVKVYEKLVGKCLTDESNACITERAKPIQNIQNNLVKAIDTLASSSTTSKAKAPSASPAGAKPTVKETLTKAKEAVVKKFGTLKEKITGPKK